MRKLKKKASQYFDSANIAESYSGVVLPLTQSFAKMVYAQVYIDLLRNSGVSAKKLSEHSDIFNNLLGFFYGRMYYNMNNWYLMAAFFPGYKRNKKNFELMITSNIKQEITTSIRPSALFTFLYPLIVAYKTSIYGISAKLFKTTVKKELRVLQTKKLNDLDYSDCIELFETINKKLLRKWYVAIENDFFVMTYLGILKKFLNDRQLQNALQFPSKSTEQVSALRSLSKKIHAVKELWQSVETNNTILFNQNLPRHTEIEVSLNDYLNLFGGRFANELKLESVGVDEDLTKLFSVLKVYQNYEFMKKDLKIDTLKLPRLKKVIVNFFLTKFKSHAELREEFRLLRSNTFGMTRRLFRKMSFILVEGGIIEQIDDVFYLQLEELLNPKIREDKNLVQRIEQRKEEFNSYKSITPPTHFASVNNALPDIEKKIKHTGKIIHANPASPGIIRGKIKIFREFSMPEKIDFDILVTSHTDPGWTSLIALSKGLIIEHGGVLSHASIVARELNIPAVIGAVNAMVTLKNNQLVEIDGSTGIIKLLSS